MSWKLTARHYWHLVKTGWLKGLPAEYRYGHPAQQLKLYGITGTDGKTTSSTLLYHVLKTAGHKVALISTVAAYIGDEAIETGFHVTSPDPAALQKLLRRCVDAGIEEVVLEVTSHGLYQYRVWGVPFTLAGITNVTREHLDYFETWEKLIEVKAQLLQRAQLAVLNQDDRAYPQLKLLVDHTQTRAVTYRQTLPPGKIGQATKQRFPQTYNQWNTNLVWTMAQEIGVSEADFQRAIQSFPGIPGRMERIANDRNLQVIVDFAHTPNALEQALGALRTGTTGRLIAVYGCAGLRDRSKRPVMGEIGSRLADLAIFTAEDPRTEDLQVILRQMKEGVQAENYRKVASVADRREAIALAIAQAKPGDTIGIFGKGHEKSMCFGTTEKPWSDQEVAQELLAAKESE